MEDVTRILSSIEQGDEGATDKLLPIVYEELRLLAARKLSHESPGQTLQATALVHEAYLRLVGEEAQDWQNSGHFFAVAAEAMRRILVDNARRKKSLKRGGRHRREDLDPADASGHCGLPVDDLIALDDALERLAEKDSVKAEVVKLRFFTGMSIEQTAVILGISPTTAKRYWSYARAWLLREIG